MRAKLKIVGKKEPVDLSYLEGKAAERMILDSTLPLETVFAIEDVWTGRKRQMDYVDFYKEDSASTKKEDLKFDAGDATAFEEEIKEYLNEKGSLTMEREFDLLCEWGLIRMKKKKPEGENITVTDFDFAIYTKSLKEYENLCERISAWKQWKGRKEFGENKRMEGYEELAAQMSI